MSWTDVVFLVSVVVLSVSFLLLIKREFPKETSVKAIGIDAIFIGLILLLGLVPQLGYIQVVPGLSITILHVPVLLGSYLYGAKKGALYGFSFGVTSMIQAAMTGVGLNALFVFPWISIIPRFLFGLISGFSFHFLKKAPKILRGLLGVGGISFLLTVLHTGLVFLDLYVFYPSEVAALFANGDQMVNGIFMAFGLVLVLGMIGEAILSAFVVPIAGRAIKRMQKR